MANADLQVNAGAGIKAELSREMGLTHVTMIGVGAMIGAGIFVLTGIAAGVAGPALILAFFLNGLVTGLTALAYAELGSSFPEAGGGYLWVKEGLPQPNGFLSGWLSWFAHAVACSLYSLAFGAFFIDALRGLGVDPVMLLAQMGIQNAHPDLAPKLMAVVITIIFCYINFRGAKETGFAGSVVTFLKVIIIALFIIFGFRYMLGQVSDWQLRFVNFFPRGAGGVIIAMGLTFIAFEGYEIIAQCGEEVKEPAKNIPRSILLSLLIVVPIYLLVAFVSLGGVDSGDIPSWQYLGNYGELAMIRAAEHFMPLGKFIFLLGGLLATISALNATIYSSSRVSFAMGRDFNLPHVFARIHQQTKTPYFAIFISGIFIIVMAVALPIEDVASATDAMFLLLFAFVNMALINLRKHRPDLERSFKVPLVPALPLIAIVSNVFLAGFLILYRPKGILVCIGYIILGVGIYQFYARRKEAKAVEAPVVVEEAFLVAESKYNILVPVANPASLSRLMDFGILVARAKQGNVIALNVVKVPMQLPPRQSYPFLDKPKKLLDKAMEKQAKTDVPLRGLIKVARNVPRAIVETAKQRKAKLIILGWRPYFKRRDYIFGNVIDETLANATCDIVMLPETAEKLYQKCQRILVPVENLDIALLSLEIAQMIKEQHDIPIVIFHVTIKETVEERKELLQKQLEELKDEVDIAKFDLKVTAGKNIVGSILYELRKTDLLIMTAGEEGLLKRALFGAIPETIAHVVENPIIFTKKYPGHIKTWFQKMMGTRKAILR